MILETGVPRGRGWAMAGAPTALSAQAITYDAVGDFSNASNPAGVWSHLKETSPSAATPLSLASKTCGNPSGLDCWNSNLPVPDFVSVIKNTTPSTASYLTIVQPTDVLNLDPEAYTAVVRFSAPTTGSYSIVGTFSGIDVDENPHPVAILESQASVFSATISKHGQSDSFDLIESLNAGDTIDFEVKTGSAGCSYCYLGTSLEATVTPGVGSTPEPSSGGRSSWEAASCTWALPHKEQCCKSRKHSPIGFGVQLMLDARSAKTNMSNRRPDSIDLCGSRSTRRFSRPTAGHVGRTRLAFRHIAVGDMACLHPPFHRFKRAERAAANPAQAI